MTHWCIPMYRSLSFSYSISKVSEICQLALFNIHVRVAARKLGCRLDVIRGSGKSRNQVFRTLVTMLISKDHSSASKSTELRSRNEKSIEHKSLWPQGMTITSIQFLLELPHPPQRSFRAVHTFCMYAMFLNCFTALHYNRRHIDIIAGCLFCKVDAKCWLSIVGDLWIQCTCCVETMRRGGGRGCRR